MVSVHVTQRHIDREGYEGERERSNQYSRDEILRVFRGGEKGWARVQIPSRRLRIGGKMER